MILLVIRTPSSYVSTPDGSMQGARSQSNRSVDSNTTGSVRLSRILDSLSDSNGSSLATSSKYDVNSTGSTSSYVALSCSRLAINIFRMPSVMYFHSEFLK
ncbi:hypothetical protein OGATHE_001636 [Ogataea polymorpha]|uniref:Uncharacterized protein n=1 Tax=Ogataea polymorpha TaxID=460523 RepID=A0A9P8PNH5_9ASCO|nr:hypothetical protein OGATHE_001636 [Ogataea polymorpha]